MPDITYTKTFNAELVSLPDEVRSSAYRVLREIGRNGDGQPTGLVKLSSLDHAFRARVGRYRIILGRSNGTWKALCIRHRSRVYRTLGPWVTEAQEATEDPFDGDEVIAREEVADVGTTRFPLRLEDLVTWRIPEEHHDALLQCASEEDLINVKGLPYEVFARVVDLMYPSDFQQLVTSASFALPSIEALEAGWKENLFGFILQLDEDQRKLAELNVATQEDAQKLGNPILVKGGPGSGKSTVALYRVRKIMETFEHSLFEPPRVLLLTYTKALTKANKDQLRELIGGMPRTVQVKTLDAVAREIVASCEPVGDILGETDNRTHTLFREAREAAGNPPSIARLTDQYLIDEVFQVIEAQGLKRRQDYLKADRRGRQAKLTEGQRKAIWSIYEAFLERLANGGYRIWEDIRWVAYNRVRTGAYPDRYDHVIIDEAQDLTPNGLRLAVELCRHPGGLYLTADSDQTLYQNGFSWQKIHEDLKFNSRNAHTLSRNFRNTRQIIEASRSFLESQGIETDADLARMQHGGLEGRRPSVVYTTPNTEIAQLKSIIHTAQKDLRQPIGNVAILVAGDQARAHDRGKKLARDLKDAGVHANYMSSSQLRLDAECVKVISLHTSKGLEFPIVIIVDVHDGVLPRDVHHLPAEERAQEFAKDVRLLYVGMSRAMRHLTVVAQEGMASQLLFDLDAAQWDLPWS